MVKTGVRGSCKNCANFRKSNYKVSSNGKHKLYGCCVHGYVVGEVDSETEKGLDTQGCSDFAEKGKGAKGVILKPGDKFKCKTVLGTECVFLYLGSKTYTEYGRERKAHYTYLVSNSKGILKNRTRRWDGMKPQEIFIRK